MIIFRNEPEWAETRPPEVARLPRALLGQGSAIACRISVREGHCETI
jgi:hypothetical protein